MFEQVEKLLRHNKFYSIPKILSEEENSFLLNQFNEQLVFKNLNNFRLCEYRNWTNSLKLTISNILKSSSSLLFKNNLLDISNCRLVDSKLTELLFDLELGVNYYFLITSDTRVEFYSDKLQIIELQKGSLFVLHESCKYIRFLNNTSFMYLKQNSSISVIKQGEFKQTSQIVNNFTLIDNYTVGSFIEYISGLISVCSCRVSHLLRSKEIKDSEHRIEKLVENKSNPILYLYILCLSGNVVIEYVEGKVELNSGEFLDITNNNDILNFSSNFKLLSLSEISEIDVFAVHLNKN